MGVLKGSFVENNQEINMEGPEFISKQNLGVSAVVPGYRLHEVLFCTQALAQRKSG